MSYIQIVKKDHKCVLPEPEPDHEPGTVWECDVCRCWYRLIRVTYNDKTLHWLGPLPR